MTGPETEGLAVTLARVEGKLDAYAARTSAVEQRQDEHDLRLRALEVANYVTPKTLAAAVLGTASVVAAITPFLDRLYS